MLDHGWTLKLVLVVALCLALGGCAASPRPAPVAISGAEAHRLIRAGGDLRVIDTRKAEDFERGRIAGSVNLPDLTPWYDRIKEPATGFQVPSAWNGEFERLGIGPGTRVLIVDAGNAERPGRGASVWYFIQRLGFDHASIVNGGFPAVEKAAASSRGGTRAFASGPQAVGEVRALAGPAYGPTGLPAYAGTRKKEEVQAWLHEPEIKLVDARSVEEYTGAEVYEGNPRGGHIPGAVLISHRDVFGPDGGLRPREEIRARLKAAGLHPNDKIVTYCQGGGRSAALAAAMLSAGYDNIANYFGSFGEWSKDQSCPVETGAAAATMKP